MTHGAEDIVDQAIAWRLRLEDATAGQWHDFVAWLEADETHRDAYDLVEMDDRLLAPREDAARSLPIPANDRATPWWQWPAAGSVVIAAALMAAVLLPGRGGADDYRIETPLGQARTIALDDGTSIDLNGGTRLKLRKGDARFAEIESGQAIFHIRHDAAHPFELMAGRYVLRDLGTMFDVSRDGPTLAVAVAQGSVLFEPSARAVTLTAGMALTIDERNDRAIVRRQAVEAVGSWRKGVTSFQDAPLSAVARAVERATGATIATAPGLAETRFTGTIHLAGSPEKVIPRAAALLNAGWERKGKSWMLTLGSDDKD